jgi:hypothetical protein
MASAEKGGYSEEAKKWGWRLALVGGIIFIIGAIAAL